MHACSAALRLVVIRSGEIGITEWMTIDTDDGINAGMHIGDYWDNPHEFVLRALCIWATRTQFTLVHRHFRSAEKHKNSIAQVLYPIVKHCAHRLRSELSRCFCIVCLESLCSRTQCLILSPSFIFTRYNLEDREIIGDLNSSTMKTSYSNAWNWRTQKSNSFGMRNSAGSQREIWWKQISDCLLSRRLWKLSTSLHLVDEMPACITHREI